jgi:hypothetical protein
MKSCPLKLKFHGKLVASRDEVQIVLQRSVSSLGGVAIQSPAAEAATTLVHEGAAVAAREHVFCDGIDSGHLLNWRDQKGFIGPRTCFHIFKIL